MDCSNNQPSSTATLSSEETKEASIYRNVPLASKTPVTGLSTQEVEERRQVGLINTSSDPQQKSIARIFAQHLLTLFNVINVSLAVLVFFTGSYRNMLFMLVVMCNVAIGIVQELRARQSLKKLSLLVSSVVEVVRSGKIKRIDPASVILGDLLHLRTGDQIPCDCRVVQGEGKVNEALLTGEATLIEKRPGDPLLSGSFVAAGSFCVEVVAVGEHSFAANLAQQVKRYKKPESQIMRTIQAIIKIATIYLVPVGVLLFLRTFFAEQATNPLTTNAAINTAILTTVAALVGMIPQGLVLLTSAVLTLAVIRLARQKVLVKEFYSVETLARVDTLCLDKTGTITTGSMHLETITPSAGATEQEVLAAAAAVMEANKEEANQTASAILKMAKDAAIRVTQYTFARRIPFLSEKKYSGCTLASGESYVVGAAEALFANTPPHPPAAADKTIRFICVARAEGFNKAGALQGEPHLLGWIGLSDELRPGIAQTLAYFRKQKVRLLILSGDNPQTAAAIAAKAGLKSEGNNHELRALNAASLVDKDSQEIIEALADVSVVGRCTPQVKQAILKAFKAANHTTAMTGDGINDILALYTADTGIAMAQGSQAARTVANLVLVDNDFSHLPDVVDEGRRSINNLIRSASLFLEKTIFSMALAAFALIVPPYPLLPIQLTLISAALIGIPSFMLALEPNHDRVEGNFFQKVATKALPAGGAISLTIAVAMVYGAFFNLGNSDISTIATLIIITVGLALLVHISAPLNVFRVTLLAGIIGILVVGVLFFAPVFELSWATGSLWIYALIFCIAAAGIYIFFTWLAEKH